MASVTGGSRLEASLARIAKEVTSAKKVDIGFLADATYPDGTSVAMVAAIQEFGAPSVGIPPRPFFRPMVAEQSPKWPALVRNALKNADMNTVKALSQVGQQISGELRASIVAVQSPALSPVTLLLRDWRSKGRIINGKTVAEARAAVASGKVSKRTGTGAKPLIDTGHMSNSIDINVE